MSSVCRGQHLNKSSTKYLVFQFFGRGEIFGELVLLDEETKSLRCFSGAKLYAYTCAEKYSGRSPRPLKCCIKKVTKIVTELPEIPNDLPGKSELCPHFQVDGAILCRIDLKDEKVD